jgi:hypothetical protein
MIDSPRRLGATRLRSARRGAAGTNNGSRIEARIAPPHLPRLIPLRRLSRDSDFSSCRGHDKEATLPLSETRLIAKRARERREEPAREPPPVAIWIFAGTKRD